MPVRSDRLAGPLVVLANTLTQLFEVPAGETWLLKDLRGFVQGVAGQTTYLYVAAPAASPEVVDAFQTLAGGHVPYGALWVACDAGVRVFVLAPVLNPLIVLASGAKLLGVAP